MRIVVIADNVTLPEDSRSLPYTEQLFDQFQRRHVEELVEALKRLPIQEVVVYEEPKTFIDNVAKHKGDLVLPSWFGKGNTARHAFISAICEAAEIMYVGCDAYAKILCK
jgi:ribosomal protein S12 methylthiotransferase accessory factor YcaO